jgi:Spy/CpxP family protein refolding chaperone
MNNLRKSFICLSLSLIVLAAPAAAPAQGFSFKWWQTERFQKELALTPEQITRIEAIFATHEPSLRAQKAALDKLENKLSKAIADPKSDEATVLQAAERLEGARAELSRTRTLQLFRIRRVLTDEQNVKLKAIHDLERERREREQKDPDRRPKGDKPHNDTACPD